MTDEHEAAPIGGDPLASISSILGEQMPEVNEHAVTEHQRQTETVAKDGTGDAEGVPFDPQLHSTGADGLGIKTAKGLWRRKRGTGGSRPRGASSVGGVRTATDASASAPESQARAAGIACAESLLMLGQMIGGSEWAPRADDKMDERKMLHEAWGNYFVATGRTDFPPGMALGMACVGYAAPRLTMPQTKEKMGRVKTWIKTKIVNWKLRKHGLQAVRRGSQSDTRDNGERENDAG